MFRLKQDGAAPVGKAVGTKTPAGKNSKEEIRALLIGYVIVPKGSWRSIPYKAHLRYFKQDGTFVRGGFFKNFWVDKGNGKEMMQLENNLNRGAGNYATWGAALDSIKTVYKKPDKSSAIEVTSMYTKIEKQRTSINVLVDAINNIDLRLKKMEKHIYRKV